MAVRILLVEDDPDIVRSLQELLEREGYAVRQTDAQDEAVRLATAPGHQAFDLALVDVTLRQGNGFAVCSAIKDATPEVPVVFLTASGDEYSTVAGLTMGADDYVAKPFRPRELLARIAAILRRSRPAAEQTLRLGDVELDPARARVTKAGRELVLTPIEYRLLLQFAAHPGRLVTRDAIREALWEEAGAYVSDNTINVYVRRLRKKIEDDPAHPQLVVTVRGLGGYRGVADPEEAPGGSPALDAGAADKGATGPDGATDQGGR